MWLYFCRLLLRPHYFHTSEWNWAQPSILQTLSNYYSQHNTPYVQEASDNLQNEPGELHPVQCDVTKEQDILAAFSWIKERLGGIDIMINNAGVLHQSFLSGRPTEMRWEAGVSFLSCPQSGRLPRADAAPMRGGWGTYYWSPGALIRYIYFCLSRYFHYLSIVQINPFRPSPNYSVTRGPVLPI
jgi:hypothetical protein